MKDAKSVQSEKKHLKMPDTIVILVIMLAVICLLTFILPAGTYDYAEDGKTVIAGTYHEVERNPAGIVEFLEAFYKGMTQGRKRSSLSRLSSAVLSGSSRTPGRSNLPSHT